MALQHGGAVVVAWKKSNSEWGPLDHGPEGCVYTRTVVWDGQCQFV